VAHNRKVTLGDVKITKAAYHSLVNAIGEKSFHELLMNQTIALDIPAIINSLKDFSIECYEICTNYAYLKSLDLWICISKKWWFDSEYLGHNIEPIIDGFQTIVEYFKLPRHRGVGYVIEEWVNSHDVEQLFSKANETFSTLIRKVEM